LALVPLHSCLLACLPVCLVDPRMICWTALLSSGCLCVV
jgi:hypothetical protein